MASRAVKIERQPRVEGVSSLQRLHQVAAADRLEDHVGVELLRLLRPQVDATVGAAQLARRSRPACCSQSMIPTFGWRSGDGPDLLVVRRDPRAVGALTVRKNSWVSGGHRRDHRVELLVGHRAVRPDLDDDDLAELTSASALLLERRRPCRRLGGPRRHRRRNRRRRAATWPRASPTRRTRLIAGGGGGFVVVVAERGGRRIDDDVAAGRRWWRHGGCRRRADAVVATWSAASACCSVHSTSPTHLLSCRGHAVHGEAEQGEDGDAERADRAATLQRAGRAARTDVVAAAPPLAQSALADRGLDEPVAQLGDRQGDAPSPGRTG